MDIAVKQRRQRFVDQSMTLQRRQATELAAHQPQMEMPLAARTGMTGVRLAVVPDVQLLRAQAILHQLPYAFNPVQERVNRLCSHHACPMANSISTAVRPNTLKLTHTRSLALKATHRLAAPSSA